MSNSFVTSALTNIPMHVLIGQPLAEAGKAQAALAHILSDFLLSVCLEPVEKSEPSIDPTGTSLIGRSIQMKTPAIINGIVPISTTPSNTYNHPSMKAIMVAFSVPKLNPTEGTMTASDLTAYVAGALSGTPTLDTANPPTFVTVTAGSGKGTATVVSINGTPISTGSNTAHVPLVNPPVVGTPVNVSAEVTFSDGAKVTIPITVTATAGPGTPPGPSTFSAAIATTGTRGIYGTGGRATYTNIDIVVPLLAIINIPALLITKVNIDFTMNVQSSSFTQDTVNTVFNYDIGASANFFGFFSGHANFNGSITTSHLAQLSNNITATYDFHIEASQNQPEGLTKVLNMVQNLVSSTNPSATNGQ
jgi:hypothetical protein